MQTSALRVSAGAKFLDEKVPRWWTRVNIDGDNLNMGEMRKCVLGQLFRDYSLGAEALNLDNAGAAQLGFWHSSGGYPQPHQYPQVTEERKELQAAWIAEVTLRRQN